MANNQVTKEGELGAAAFKRGNFGDSYLHYSNARDLINRSADADDKIWLSTALRNLASAAMEMLQNNNFGNTHLTPEDALQFAKGYAREAMDAAGGNTDDYNRSQALLEKINSYPTSQTYEVDPIGGNGR